MCMRMCGEGDRGRGGGGKTGRSTEGMDECMEEEMRRDRTERPMG
jgi:hypothetical protein